MGTDQLKLADQHIHLADITQRNRYVLKVPVSSLANEPATDATPSETSGESAIPTAGAISQPLQSSVVGLLGFLIVGLILV